MRCPAAEARDAAAPGGLRAGLGDVAQAGHRALCATACGGGTGLERRLRAAGRRRGGTRTAAGQLGGSRRHARPGHATRRPRPSRQRRRQRPCRLRRQQHRPSRPRRAAAHRTPGPWRCQGRRSQRQQGERGQHDDQRVVDGRLGGMDLELGEQARADADDHGQHQHLDAGGHHVAQHLFGEERGLVPERERHQHEARERGQLELDQRDEKLDRQHEEAQHHDQPSEEHHHDGIEVHEHLGKSRHVADLLQNRRPGVDAGFRQPARLQEVLHRDGRAGGRQAQPANERNTMPASQLKLPMM
jgi:hypothetical protein